MQTFKDKFLVTEHENKIVLLQYFMYQKKKLPYFTSLKIISLIIIPPSFRLWKNLNFVYVALLIYSDLFVK